MRMTTSKPVYVYLQRPDTGEWVTVGRLTRPATASENGYFQYAPSYLDAGLTWSIDPVNLPVVRGQSYPATRYGGLHDVLRDAAPVQDGRELFGRMVFNAVIGNDDDHPRNHAARYLHEEGRWRLAPAYDVVPNTDFTPRYLAMQLSTGDREISRQAALKDARAFGFGSPSEAAEYLDELLARIVEGFAAMRGMLDGPLQNMMIERLGEGLSRMRG